MKAFIATPALDAVKGMTHYSEEFIAAKDKWSNKRMKSIYLLIVRS